MQIRLTAKKHREDCEDFLRVGDCGNVAEANGSENGEGEVEGGDVLGTRVRAAQRVIAHIGHACVTKN